MPGSVHVMHSFAVCSRLQRWSVLFCVSHTRCSSRLLTAGRSKFIFHHVALPVDMAVTDDMAVYDDRAVYDDTTFPDDKAVFDDMLGPDDVEMPDDMVVSNDIEMADDMALFDDIAFL